LNSFEKIDLTKFYREANVAVIGDIMVDRYLKGTVDRISPEAPVPIVFVEDVKNIPGGAANVMANASGLGARVMALGVVGDDSEGKFVISDLFNRGVDVHNILVDTDRSTTLKCRVMVGSHMMMRYDMENRHSISQELESKLVNSFEQIAKLVDILVISDYEKGLMTQSLIKSILNIAERYNLCTLVDPKARSIWHYVGIKYVKINLLNAEIATGISRSSHEDDARICSVIADTLDCESVILTIGKQGLSIFSQGKLDHVSAMAKDIYDVTGAGDVVSSVLGIALANGYNIKDACCISTIAAGIKVGKVGTYSLTLEELIDKINRYNESSLK